MKTLYEDADKWHNQYRKKSGNERYRYIKSGLLCFYFTEPFSLLVVVTIH